MPISISGLASIVATIALCFGGFCHSASAQGATYKIVAFTGQTAPGGRTYSRFDVPRIGADGSVGFVQLDTRFEGFQTSIYAGLPGALRVVISKGDPVPGAEGGIFADFGNVSVSRDGLVGFNAGITLDGYVRGVWSESTEGLAPNPPDDPNYPAVTEIGLAAFRSGTVFVKGQFLPSGSGDRSNKPVGAIMKDVAGSLKDVLTEGHVFDGHLMQKIYSCDDGESAIGEHLDMNESGAVAMKVAVAPGASPTPYPKEAIYAGNLADPQLLALQDDVAPGFTDARYQHFSPRPSIAANGLVAFSSSLVSEGSGPASAIFSGSRGGVVPLVREGSIVPTTSDVTFGTLSDAVVNSTGDVIFRAKIWYPNETSREGIWVKRRTGSPVLLAVSGMSLPTPSGMREVEAVDFAGPGTFNDLHEFVFRAQFTDGDEGIYLADTRPGSPTVHIVRPTKPRDYVTQDTKITVAGTAADDTGVEKVEYTVAREVSAAKRHGKKRGKKKLIVSRTKLARGGTSWNFKVPLSMGLNLISIVATDKLGNASESYKVRILRYDDAE